MHTKAYLDYVRALARLTNGFKVWNSSDTAYNGSGHDIIQRESLKNSLAKISPAGNTLLLGKSVTDEELVHLKSPMSDTRSLV